MKLATYHDGSRDGQLLVVSRDLREACYASSVATRLQSALEDWNFFSPQLQDVYDALNAGRMRHAFPFEPARCLAPLPRTWLRLEGQGWSHPGQDRSGLHLRSGTGLAGPQAVLTAASVGHGLDVGAQLAVVTGDVPQQAGPAQALDGVRLLLLMAGVSWPVEGDSPPGEREAAAAGSLMWRWPALCAPVAVTMDELGEAWREGRAHVTLHTWHQGRRLGLGDAGADMARGFDALVAEAARGGPLPAGTLVSGGTVAMHTQGQGQHCLADRRASELARDGRAHTAWLQAGEAMRFEIKGRDGLSLCGAIEVAVAQAGGQSAAVLPEGHGA